MKTTATIGQARQAETTRRKRIWWLAGGLIAAATVALALIVGLFGSNTPSGSTTVRLASRIFADERGYVPTVEEYQTVLLEPVASAPVIEQGYLSGEAPGTLRCQVAVATGLARCLPQWERSQGSGSRLSGPR